MPHSVRIFKSKVSLRCHVAMNLNICCTIFWDVFFRFQGEILMHFEPFQPTNRLLVLKTAFRQIAENSTFTILLSKMLLFCSQIQVLQTFQNGCFMISANLSYCHIDILASNSMWYFFKTTGNYKKAFPRLVKIGINSHLMTYNLEKSFFAISRGFKKIPH